MYKFKIKMFKKYYRINLKNQSNKTKRETSNRNKKFYKNQIKRNQFSNKYGTNKNSYKKKRKKNGVLIKI